MNQISSGKSSLADCSRSVCWRLRQGLRGNTYVVPLRRGEECASFPKQFLVVDHFIELLFLGTYFGVLRSRSSLHLAINVYRRSRFILLNESSLGRQSLWIRHDGSAEISLKVSLYLSAVSVLVYVFQSVLI